MTDKEVIEAAKDHARDVAVSMITQFGPTIPAEMLEPNDSSVAQERLIEESFRKRLGI